MQVITPEESKFNPETPNEKQGLVRKIYEGEKLSVYCVGGVGVQCICLYWALGFRMKKNRSAAFLAKAATVHRKSKCRQMQFFLLKNGQKGQEGGMRR